MSAFISLNFARYRSRENPAAMVRRTLKWSAPSMLTTIRSAAEPFHHRVEHGLAAEQAPAVLLAEPVGLGAGDDGPAPFSFPGSGTPVRVPGTTRRVGA